MKNREKEIMDAAIEVFSKAGYADSTISQIVKKAGLAQGTFCIYYKSKKELFLKLIDEFLSIMFMRINSINVFEIKSKEDIELQITKLYEIIFKTCIDNENLAKIIFREATTINHDFEEKMHQFYTLCSEYVKRYLDIGIQKGFIQDLNADILSYSLIGMLEKVTYKYIIEDKKYPVEYIIKNMARFECYGLIGGKSNEEK